MNIQLNELKVEIVDFVFSCACAIACVLAIVTVPRIFVVCARFTIKGF